MELPQCLGDLWSPTVAETSRALCLHWDLAGDLLFADVEMHRRCFSPVCKDPVIFIFVSAGLLTRSLSRGRGVLLPLLKKKILLCFCSFVINAGHGSQTLCFGAGWFCWPLCFHSVSVFLY